MPYTAKEGTSGTDATELIRFLFVGHYFVVNGYHGILPMRLCDS